MGIWLYEWFRKVVTFIQVPIRFFGTIDAGCACTHDQPNPFSTVSLYYFGHMLSEIILLQCIFHQTVVAALPQRRNLDVFWDIHQTEKTRNITIRPFTERQSRLVYR